MRQGSNEDGTRLARWGIHFFNGILTINLIYVLFIIAVMLFAGGSAYGSGSATGNLPEVHVGSELEFPPYAFVDENGQAAGFSVELIKAVAGAMGLSVRISTGPWDTMWNNLMTGKLDVLPITAKSPERQKLVDFSLPHTETFDAFFTRKGDPTIRNIAAARGKEIVVMRSDAAHHELLMLRRLVKKCTRELAEKNEMLSHAYDYLEVRVQERTAELAQANKSLQIESIERKHSEEEREKFVAEIQESLARVKQLSGLIPICASCKKIRDDKGYWEEVASYITKHSDARFSHGMCPECSEKAYEELEKLKREGGL